VLEFNLYFILILLTRWERQKVQSITGILKRFLIIDKTKLASLLDTINDIDTLKDNGQDIIGRVYESQ
jgi:hypothetical protein